MFLFIYLEFRNSYFQGTTLFFWIIFKCFIEKKSKVSGKTKPRLSFWLKIFLREIPSNEHFDLRKKENSGTAIFKGQLFFMKKKKNESLWNKKLRALGQIKPGFSSWLKINFREMESYKFIDLRKIENIVRSISWRYIER